MCWGLNGQALVICWVWVFEEGRGGVVKLMSWATDWTVVPVPEMGKARFIGVSDSFITGCGFEL